MSILEYKNLTLSYKDSETLHHADLIIPENKITVIVGQSGSGKSTLLKATIGLLNEDAFIEEGDILFKGESLLHQDLSKYRGKKIGMIFQNPLTYLDGFRTIEYHFYETLHYHFNYSKETSNEIAISYLKLMGLDETILEKYPYELSGGMGQRVMIALVLCLEPEIILADEPTSNLDVVCQKEILDLILSLKKKTTFVFVTHNIQVAKYLGDQLVVIKDGHIIEQGVKDELFSNPKHEYTQRLVMKGKENGFIESK